VFSVQFPDPLISGLWLLGEKEQLNAGAHINFVIKSHLIIIIEWAHALFGLPVPCDSWDGDSRKGLGTWVGMWNKETKKKWKGQKTK